MSDCPEHVKQVVLNHGVEGTLRHVLTFVQEQKQRASDACCSYDADEKDHYDLRKATEQEEALKRALE